ncbi:hypothetical protein OS493_021777 [Desmophyllum pertusum]|uniref:Uncharacterized protein n=1 Tax=Desmophyllum pertusum TaxID=174260 RepID=A0A9X0D8X2_9CNID|nr:hypothetical protein OS493_021777 [Desmophyllum pertusum]
MSATEESAEIKLQMMAIVRNKSHKKVIHRKKLSMFQHNPPIKMAAILLSLPRRRTTKPAATQEEEEEEDSKMEEPAMSVVISEPDKDVTTQEANAQTEGRESPVGNADVFCRESRESCRNHRRRVNRLGCSTDI